ncbi:type II and III secretion system protein family protein [Allosphingosinicella vermicomposti]|uniref:type II and III secretion system protein family protein n=1 Tax=Allosphingosinicella vermicomposti TaxID=614671 RepID=UPI000D0FD13D|nr:type II and III secretion system protein family protein [Allosphingosinicella vermicomposti]
MKSKSFMAKGRIGFAVAALMASGVVILPAAAQAQSAAVQPANDVAISVGTGRMVQLDGAMSDLFVANDTVADVQVRSANQIYIFGKAAGETTVYATNKAGKIVYSANVRVGKNIDSIDDMLRAAMPDAQIQAMPMNGFVLLTGTVAAPADVEDATRLTQAFVGEGMQVINRLRTATPLQVMLQVKIAEVSRSLVKEIGFNLLSRDRTSGFLFGIGSGGRNIGSIGQVPLTDFPKLDASSLYGLPAGSLQLPFNPATGQFITGPTSNVPSYTTNRDLGVNTTLNFAGNLLGVDILSALDLHQDDGRVQTLAEPTLVALSGETASFLAGGEFPIIISTGLNGNTVEFKEYGVSLAFTPTVLDGGRISMRVRPEVSELTEVGAITLNDYTIPALTTRRTETTVELGSGQSFMIGGLLRNNGNNRVTKAPFLGDLPIIGALFRSTSFQRNETELVIVVTPYLVKPVSANQIALPTDGYRNSNDAERTLLDRAHHSQPGEQRPKPSVATPQTVLPAGATPANSSGPAPKSNAAPGFSF